MQTARDLARSISAELIGDGDIRLTGVAAPEAAGEYDLIFLENARYAERAQTSRARCAIVGAGIELAGKTLLRVAHPKLSFAQAAAILLPPVAPPRGIHPTAVIGSSARIEKSASIGAGCVIEEEVEIGEGAAISAHCVIGRGARIGAHCVLFPHVTLYAGVRLGSRVVIHSGAVLGSDGFGYVFAEGRHWKFPQMGSLVVEDDVEIGANTAIDRGSLGITRIAAGSKLDNLVQIAHNVSVGEHSIIAAQTGVSGSSSIGSRAVIAGQVGIADRCHIEDGAVVGAQAGIPSGKRIRAGEPVWGTPARPLSRFKAQYALLGQLGRMFERLKKIEERLGIELQAGRKSDE